ncbi:hypothetical protein NECAME_07295 [Necator americanus]|uniref:Secreted protein n=1 Tax=Necator americanus TaxID=51031 RepID=W2TPD6_NECAM|nr:hypothetical protein NECAME_07295 [Necator americanus]ETN83638.1 hypothetical protein NECAME_07295 [Necator americanus]
MRGLTVLLLATVIAAVLASKENGDSKGVSSRSSSEEGKTVEASGEEVLRKIEVGDQNLESSGAADTTLIKEEAGRSQEPEGSGEAIKE